MKSLLILKPDAFVDEIIRNEIFKLVSVYGLKIIYSVPARLPQACFEEFYFEHAGQPYFSPMIEWLSSSFVMIVILKGKDALKICRENIVGRGNTGLRGKFKKNGLKNLAHASDSLASFEREIFVLKKYAPLDFV